MINSEVFIQEIVDKKFLDNIGKYCTNCYKELQIDDKIFYNTQNFEYICFECACCISYELQTQNECQLEECQQESSLF